MIAQLVHAGFKALREKGGRVSSVARHFGDWLDYQYSLLKNEPYLGPVMAASQTWPERRPYMEDLARTEVLRVQGNFVRVAEVGSWAGGSSILWGNVIVKYNRRKGRVFCVDPWHPYVASERDSSKTHRRMAAASQQDKIFGLFQHNIRAAGLEDIVTVYRGASDDVLPTLRDRFFDIVYIDGIHAYSQVSRDIENGARLVVPGGVLCGDDLELQLHQVDRAFAWENRERDWVFAEGPNSYFHPGVALAVGEFFGQPVSSSHGFWAMRRLDAGWAPVILEKVAPQPSDSDRTRVGV